MLYERFACLLRPSLLKTVAYLVKSQIHSHLSWNQRSWRLTLYPHGEAGWGELFDNASDPGEHCNLYASTDPEVVCVRERLRERLQRDFSAAADTGTPMIAKW